MSDQEIISIDDDEVESKPSDSDAESNIPDTKTCQERVEQFASITGTDEALAQFYLQDRNWNLETSVNAFFEETGKEAGNSLPAPTGSLDDSDILVTFDAQMAARMAGNITTVPPKTFRLITWNIDGLDDRNLKKRTKAVAKILEEEKADIVFLQELIPQTYTYLENHLPQFRFLVGGDSDYFTATLLRKTTVYYDNHKLLEFDNSAMGRNLLCVQAHIGDVKLNLLNTHLESTAEFAKQRTEQMKICFDKMKTTPSNFSTIFGGDLNARDKEIDATKIPNVFDLWESCGRRQECKYTWDTARNTNKEMPGRYKPRTRFDRVFFKQASPPILTPKHFGLVGIQKVQGTQSFPSDHWGLIIHFQVVD